jgi:hypothetical protein
MEEIPDDSDEKNRYTLLEGVAAMKREKLIGNSLKPRKK